MIERRLRKDISILENQFDFMPRKIDNEGNAYP